MLYLVATLLSLAAASVAAQRQFEIINNCAETLWPALTNQGPEYLRSYTGLRGWTAPPGHRQTLMLPENWNGRIWPRRKCNFTPYGQGSCVTGNCASGINCKDDEGDFFSLGEFNLNSWGSLDFYDLSFVAGFDVPMSIAPAGCQELACAPDMTKICPDERMKQRDASGNVLGCRSACFAGINAQIPSINCCSGIYESIPACVPERVDYYNVFKPICPNAFWYPRDQRDGHPQVDWACPAGNKPKYMITFCPIGSAKIGSKNVAIVTTGTTTDGSTDTDATTVPSPTDTAVTAGASSVSESAAVSSASASGAASSATPSSTATESIKILGLSKAVFITICVAAGLVVSGVLVCCCCCGPSRSSAAAAAPVAANELGVSDSEEEGEKRFRRRYSHDAPLLRS
ncbi:hypothetical protein JCM8115_001521 [Rhodotorula mucilaginosa]